jgi:hypothetical protein
LIVVDLRQRRERLLADIRASLATFSDQHPHVEICTVGLWGDGFHGTISLHLDTPTHSQSYVDEWRERGIPAYWADDEGEFCLNCYDFQYHIGEYELLDYPDYYETDSEEPIEYINLDGSRSSVDRDQGNEAFHSILFPFLKEVIALFEPFPQLNRAAPFRVVAQTHESCFEESWILE